VSHSSSTLARARAHSPGRLRWRKVRGDLLQHPARSLLLALALVAGCGATAVAISARAILSREVPRSFARALPVTAILTVDRASDSLVARVRQLDGVIDAEARRLVRARVEVAAGDWRPLLLYAVPDFSEQRVSIVRLASGARTPAAGAVLVERSGLPVLGGASRGTPATLRVRAPGGVTRDLVVSGLVHDAAQAPGWQDNVVYAYAQPATLALLGQGEHLDEVRVRTGDSREAATAVVARIAQTLAGAGHPAQRIELPLMEHPHTDHMRTMLLLLTAFGALALLLAAALTGTVMQATLARQVRQIGIMKAVGATRRQIGSLSLLHVLSIAVPATLIGVTLGALLGRQFAVFAASQLNLDVGSLAVPASALLLACILGLIAPLLAAVVPVLRATRVSVHEAISDAGAAPASAEGVRTMPWRTRAARPGAVERALAFRNLLRRPGRLALTVSALGLGGAVLLTAANVYRSLERAVTDALAQRDDDVDVRLLRSAPAPALLRDVRAIEGVRSVEVWGHALASLVLPRSRSDGGTPIGTGRYSLLAPPHDTPLLRLPLAEGRLLQRDDRDAIVVDRALQAREPMLQLGAEVLLIVSGAAGPVTRSVRVVGVVELIEEPTIYTTPALLAAMGTPHAGPAADTTPRAAALRIVAAPGQESLVATRVEERLVDAGAFPVYVMTKGALRRAMTDHFVILLALLSAVAAAAILVGALSLGASTAITALERTREIGVMRAIGASSRSVTRMLMLEGAAAAGLSALLALLLSLPLSLGVGTLVGRHGLHVALPFEVSALGIVAWLSVVAVVGWIACRIPATQALRQPVHETLVTG
jgi:putative ABC transport system permease protein